MEQLLKKRLLSGEAVVVVYANDFVRLDDKAYSLRERSRPDPGDEQPEPEPEHNRYESSLGKIAKLYGATVEFDAAAIRQRADEIMALFDGDCKVCGRPAGCLHDRLTAWRMAIGEPWQ